MFSDLYFDKMGDRIEKLGTAIFSNSSESVLKFPTSIIHVLCVDDNQKIWFAVPKPYADISGMEMTFPVTLHFFNKNYNYYINVDGIASIISKLDDMPRELVKYTEEVDKNPLLIRVRVNYLEYSVRKIKAQMNFYDKIINSMRWVSYNESVHYSV